MFFVDVEDNSKKNLWLQIASGALGALTCVCAGRMQKVNFQLLTREYLSFSNLLTQKMFTNDWI